MSSPTTFHKTARQLGILKHHTQRVYRLAYDTNTLKDQIREKQMRLNQVQTVLRVQKDYLEELSAALAVPVSTDATRFVQLYYDIARREEEAETLIHQLHQAKKEYAYHIHEIQDSHTEMLQLIQDTERVIQEWPKEVSFDASFKAIQHTIPSQTHIKTTHERSV